MNATIRTKLLGGFAIVLALLVATSIYTINQFSASNERLSSIVDVSAKKIDLSHGLMIGILEASRHEKNIILEKDPIRKDYFKDRISKPLADIDEKSAALYELVDEQGKTLLNEFLVAWKAYKLQLDTIIRLALENKSEEAYRISIEEGLKVRDEAILQLDRLVKKNEQSMAVDKAQNDKSYANAFRLIVILVLLSVLVAAGISYWIIRSITSRIASIAREAERIASRELSAGMPADPISDELKPIAVSLASVNESFREVTSNADAVASGNYATDFTPRSEKDVLGHALKKMTRSLRESTEANERHNWLGTGKNKLNERLMGNQDVGELSSNVIALLAAYVDAGLGAMYLYQEDGNSLVLSGRYAFTAPGEMKETFSLGEGLVGQAARELRQISVSDVNDAQLRISSSVLNAKPRHLLITPFAFEGKVLGVIELGRLKPFTETEMEFIGSSMETIAIAVNSAMARKKIQELLERTQVQSEELQAQQEELKQMNEELEEQAQNLKQQQEELQMTNEELEEQTQALEMKNREVEAASADIAQKSRQLELSSKYKSEFLANMSHELRTPLNSLLILSKDLADNSGKNLTKDQVESAEIIHKSGQDLLVLINDVLDLSKVEAGKMGVHAEKIRLNDLVHELLRDFRRQADQKGLELRATFGKDAPEYIRTDPQRLNQILRNLISNAVKFTDKGSVEVSVNKHTDNLLSISVIDSGIGIEEEKQAIIFEAFQQADGGTSRKYGGTGLGLSISRELARLLGGEIKLSSKANSGSTFSLILPVEIEAAQGGTGYTAPPPEPPKRPAERRSLFLDYPALEDDRANLAKGDKIVLVVEDDLKFAGILMKQARDKGFKCLSAATGEDGLALAAKYTPHAIILDIDLPGISGRTVLTELKADPSLRHIPVHIVSVNERSIETIKEGAVEYLMKPVNKKDIDDALNRIEQFVNRQMKNLLIVEDDRNSRAAIRKLIGNGDVKCFEAGTAEEALSIFREKHIDCIVLDIGLPDMSGFELIHELEKMRTHSLPPIIIYTGKELSREENEELQKYAESIIIKGVRSEERLLDETALFLHRTISSLPESKRSIINNLYDKEALLRGKKILLVDDDMRNVFALSKVMKERGMEIVKADNGRHALETLAQHSDIDLVLMDIMMPEMDGYEAMSRIRAQERLKKLPIIALTAKAMKDDKQKCIDAGANDYIMKPVDVERLLTLMRVWLSKK